MARVVLDAATWAMVRVAYEDTTESVTRIITRFGLGRQQLYDQIALENWQMRSTARVKTPADVPPRSVPPQGSVQVEAASPSPAHKLDVPVQTHAQRLDRLHRIVDRLLEKMESNMTNTSDMSPQEQERAAKALTSTLTAFERVTDLADAQSKAPETSDGGTSHDSAEADRMRREIAERLERLSIKWLEGTAKPE
jgi:hypothetical protein